MLTSILSVISTFKKGVRMWMLPRSFYIATDLLYRQSFRYNQVSLLQIHYACMCSPSFILPSYKVYRVVRSLKRDVRRRC